ncbi:hypothetical protein QAD02_006874 [Eretmocerus hayati]|uniref:Uncharacterized protein n=1 Tax=Eretmocerus hayati TaxID=131215 RepID=A0ACC2N2F0_9HYME|nr:hypothetical protein QAD02_006874 [Eretmocerus hayati]
MAIPKFLFLLLLNLTIFVLAQQKPEKIVYEWKVINFEWPSDEDYESAVANGSYVEENVGLGGIKVWKDKIYLTSPRYKDGIPATLMVVPVEPTDGNSSPNLAPYPSWSMQEIGNCSALQYVQSMEIDPLGRMWVLDTGRINLLQLKTQNLCPPRLVIFDLEEDGRILLDYEFPEDVAPPDLAFLDDIVLEHEDGGFAYITDTALSGTPGIIVFSLAERESWRVEHDSMKPTDVDFTVQYDNTPVDIPVGLDGIALSPASTEGDRTLYYSPLSSYTVYSIPTQVLRSRPSDIEDDLTILGTRQSQSDGMIMSADGRLFFGLVGDNAVSVWDSAEPPFSDNQHQIFQDNIVMQWPDTFSIDIDGNLWCVTNRLQTYVHTVNTSATNFRVLKLGNIDATNYQYYPNGRAPEPPLIESLEDSS